MSDLKRARTATAADAVASEPPAGGSLAGFVDLQARQLKPAQLPLALPLADTGASKCQCSAAAPHGR